MIKKRELLLVCKYGELYIYSNEYLGMFTMDKKHAKLRRYKIVQNGDNETTQIVPVRDLRFAAKHLGNTDLNEISDYEQLVKSKVETGWH